MESEKIKNIIMNSYPGEIFIPSDFFEVVSSINTINKSLTRLAEAGTIRRIMRGIYERPRYNEFLQEYVSPLPDKVAKALARKFGWKTAPSGETALNIFGLSAQVPAVWTYVSDGPYKEFELECITIRFKHVANKVISNMSEKTRLVIQAIKAMGKENIDDKAIRIISGSLEISEKETMLIEAKHTTVWVYDCIKKICKLYD